MITQRQKYLWGQRGHRILQLFPSTAGVHFPPSWLPWPIECDTRADVPRPQEAWQLLLLLLGIFPPLRRKLRLDISTTRSPRREGPRWQPAPWHQACGMSPSTPSSPRTAAQMAGAMRSQGKNCPAQTENDDPITMVAFSHLSFGEVCYTATDNWYIAPQSRWRNRGSGRSRNFCLRAERQQVAESWFELDLTIPDSPWLG